MQPADAQQLFFQHIKGLLPSHLSLADEVANVLNISNDSAYRRIRGEKQIALEEIKKLCVHFKMIAGGVPLWEMPIAQQQAVLDVNLGGVLALARAAVPALLRRSEPRSGRFLAVASTAATRGLPKLAAYCASKAGVTGLIRALAVELGTTGVTANAVSPGSTDTALLEESGRIYALADAQTFAAQQPMQRLLDPAEVAALLVFLAGLGSSAMTGAVVPVDGGLAL